MDTQLWQLRFDSPLEFVSICASWTQSQCSVRCGFARERRRQSDRADLEWCNDAEAGREIKKRVERHGVVTHQWLVGFPLFQTTTLPVVFILFFRATCPLAASLSKLCVGIVWNC